MFGHKKDRPPPSHPEIAVDVTLEDDIDDVERTVEEFLQIPSEGSRRALLSALERLDDQTARSDARQFANSAPGSYGQYGLFGDAVVLGATSRYPVAEEIAGDEFQAQIALVKAAKQAVTHSSPDSLEVLRRANASLATIRVEHQSSRVTPAEGTSSRLELQQPPEGN
jgi:hypothetical protein